jgi:hypothetical protein
VTGAPTRKERIMSSRGFAQVAGVIYLLVGILGLFGIFVVPPPADVPAMSVHAGYGYLLGLFPVNVIHNIVHLGVGVWGLAAARNLDSARGFARGLAVFYGVLTVMGLVPGLNTVFGLIPIFGHDVWLHAVTAAVAAYFGFAERRAPAGTTASL